MSTGDQHAQGNWGVKDMIEAMRWVRSNIHLFGGNPNQITAFGESAGSVGVSLLFEKFKFCFQEFYFLISKVHYLLLTQMGAGVSIKIFLSIAKFI